MRAIIPYVAMNGANRCQSVISRMVRKEIHVKTVPGIDVSHWQSVINWTQVRETGARFAVIKATEGTNFVDNRFTTNWREAKAAGLMRGAYCYFHPDLDARTQADHFVNAVNATNDRAELPPALDLEVANGVDKTQIISRVKVWLDRVEQRLGRKPFIYSGISFLETYLSEIGGAPPAWSKDYPLWLGWYPYNYTPGMKPRLPRGWFTWTIWQYSKDGQVNGINAEVDMDLFNGTLKNLYEFCGINFPALAPVQHTVQAGDTLESILSKFGVTLAELEAANPQIIQPGTRLTIPIASELIETGTIVTQPKTYTVKAGDNLTKIANMFQTTVVALVALNNIPNPDLIQVGQVLKIP
jgi:lysozyme